MEREVGGHRRGRARGALAALLAIALTALAGCGGASTREHAQPTTTPVLVFPTRTPKPADPISLGWEQLASGQYGSARFAPSDPRRGYFCANNHDSATSEGVFGVSTDGGQTWQLKPSPQAYMTCRIAVSPTDPLKLTLNSVNLPGDGQSAFVDAHYSSDGGQTWQAAPIPPNTLGSAGAIWVGASLFTYIGPNKGQAPALFVSANGGAATQVDMSTIIPHDPTPSIWSAVTDGNTLYLTLFGLCTPNCTVLVATSDGGKTWRQLANPLNLTVDAMAGTMLYAHLFNAMPPFILRVMRTADGGATWSAVEVPTLPDGTSSVEYQVAPDGTIFSATPHAVYALHGQTWSAIIFATSGTWAVSVIGFATDAAGHPTRVYVAYEGPQGGIFAHTL
jgi:hypothetical protein